MENEIKSGILPNTYDLRDHSYERTFGSVDLKSLPDEYNADLAYDFPDQNADGYPNGCSGYTQTETGQDEYGIPFDHSYTYKRACEIANVAVGNPLPIRASMKATSVYGLKPRDGTDADALQYKRGKYFDVDKVGDYFDGVRSALWMERLHKRTVSAGSPWQWSNVGGDGLMRSFNTKNISGVWHNYKLTGWTNHNGKPHLLIKAWLGPDYGWGGYGLMSRAVFNKLMKTSGTFMYMQRNAGPEDIQNIRLDILEYLLMLYQRLSKTLGVWTNLLPK